MNKLPHKIFVVFTLCSFLIPSLTLASNLDIDYNNLLSDAEAENHSSMSQIEIKNFLIQNNSYLKSYFYNGNNPGPADAPINSEEDYYKNRSATEIIYNAAWEAKINPQFLLAMLQKEQGLIEDSEPSERQLNYAMGYYCFDGQPCNPQWKGFGKQVRATALQFRDYLDNIYVRPHYPGKTSIIDGQAVKPENKITAALYVYTPHLQGNNLFATLWERYSFGGPGDISGGIFPDGSLIKAKDGEDVVTIYLIDRSQKRPFDSMTALVSRYDPKKVLEVSSEELAKYEDGGSIKYPNYSVLQGADGSRYLLDGMEKRLIVSDEAFRQLGFNPAEIIEANQTDLDNFIDGSLLTEGDLSPFEQLLRDMSTGGVYYVKDNQKAPIVHPSIIAINYSDLSIKEVTSKTLEQYTKVLPVKIQDGNLIKTEDEAKVYVISNGQRRLIPDEATFVGLGYNWSQIQTVTDRVLKLHDLGEELSL